MDSADDKRGQTFGETSGEVQIHRRLTLPTPVIVLQERDEDRRKTFFGYAKNISRGGMFIGSTCPHQPGSKFSIEFPLPSPFRQLVNCTCEIVWNRSYQSGNLHEPGMGLRFLDIPEDAAQSIDDWVNSTD